MDLFNQYLDVYYVDSYILEEVKRASTLEALKQINVEGVHSPDIKKRG